MSCEPVQLPALKWLQRVILASVSQRCACYWSAHKEGNTLSLSSSIVKLSSDCSRDPCRNLFLPSNISSHHRTARFCSISLVTVNRSQMVISCFWIELKTMSACPGPCQMSLFAASVSCHIFLKSIFRIQFFLLHHYLLPSWQLKSPIFCHPYVLFKILLQPHSFSLLSLPKLSFSSLYFAIHPIISTSKRKTLQNPSELSPN